MYVRLSICYQTTFSRRGFPGGSNGKESAWNAGDFLTVPGSGRSTIPTAVFLPGESHGQRSLAGYSSWTVHNWT